MARYDVKDIRNIALIGHGSSGKTSLAEAILFKAKSTNRMGSVDDGTSIFDYEEDEREKKISIDSAIAHCKWNGKEINLIDTPGYPDFISGVIGSLFAVDTVLIVVSAINGIQINTRKVWQLATERGLCRAVVITKMDGENIDLASILKSINETFGKGCIPMNLPRGCGHEFNGVVSALNPPAGEDTNNVVGDLKTAQKTLVESIVSIDDELMEMYLEGREIDKERLNACLINSIANASIVPVFFCSSRKGLGIEELLNGVVDLFPSPENGLKRICKDLEANEDIRLCAKKDETLSAQVFKVTIDPFVGRISYFRVFSGWLDSSLPLFNSRIKKKEKINHIYRVFGKELEPVEAAIPGDIIAVSKVEDMEVSDTLCSEKRPLAFDIIRFPTPMVSLALELKAKGAEYKLSEVLAKLVSEDKTFKVSHDSQTNELVVTGISSLHLNIIINRMKKRFDIEVNTKPPKIPYKEAITGKSMAQYKHKKQSGGRGQYGEVYIRIEPLKRGEGFKFVNSIVGGAIPGQYIPAVEKGVKEALSKGILAGYPIVDIEVDLYDGSFHDVDSSEAAFKIAAAKALHDAFMQARPVLLEPIVNIEVAIPGEFMGEISGNLSSRRGRIQGMDSIGDIQVVKASIAMAEVINYESELKSLTGGQGSYTMEFSHYDIVPPHIAEDVIKHSKKSTEKVE